MTDQKPAMKVDVSVIGPCHPSYGSFGDDRDTRHVLVEISAATNDAVFTNNIGDFILETSTLWLRESARWAEPLVSSPRWKTGNFGMDAVRLAHALKQMKALSAYVQKFPVQPRTLAEWTAAVLSFLKAKGDDITFTQWPNHHARATHDISRQDASASYVAYHVKEAEDGLIPQKVEVA